MRRTSSRPAVWRRSGRPVVLVLGSVLVLIAATALGMAVPARAVLTDAVAFGDPDYAARTGDVAPLSEAFLTEVLGLPAARGSDVQQVLDDGAGATTADASRSRAAGGDAAPATRSGPTTIVHAPTNDDFDDSFVVAEGQLPFTGTTRPSAATRERREPTVCDSSVGSLWYSLRAEEATGLVAQVTTNAGEATLAVFRGEDLDSLTLVGCDTGLFGAATVSFEATPETLYHFQVITDAARSSFSLDRLGTIALVNRRLDGTRADASTKWMPNLSNNGRWVVFPTYAQLVAEDTNDLVDFYRVELGEDGRPVDVDLVTVGADGGSADDHSRGAQAAVSDDGRWVAFQSAASNLTGEPDTNGTYDVFLRDMERGETRRITRRFDGGEARHATPSPTVYWPALDAQCESQDEVERNEYGFGCTGLHSVDITPDGRYVVFESALWGLVEGHGEPVYSPQTLGREVVQDWQAYRFDRTRGVLELASADEHGEFMKSAGLHPAVSHDGRWVAFAQHAEGPVRPSNPQTVDPAHDANILLKDMHSGALTLVSRAHATGDRADGRSIRPTISGDGRYVVFMSEARDMLAPSSPYQDTNEENDVYWYDRVSGRMQLASLRGEASTQDPSSGTPGGGRASYVGVSDDGRYVVFLQGSLQEMEPDDVDTLGTCTNLVYRRDLVTRTTTPISIGQNGRPDTCSWGLGALSGDGRRAVWVSETSAWTEVDGGSGPESPWADTYVFTSSRALPSS